MNMRSVLRSSIGLATLCVSPTAFGQSTEDEVILVTAARVPVSAEDATSSISLLDADALEARGAVFVADALRAVPGLAVSRSGPAGALTQIRARGSEANHLVLLIDGIEAANPFTGEAEFAHLAFDDIESIEVSRGEQSALWGADAIGGVIRLTSARAQSGTDVSARLEAGSFDQVRASARLSTRYENGWIALSGSGLTTDGIDVSGLDGETDGYDNLTLAASGRYDLSPVFALEGSVRWIDSDSQFDADTDFDGRLDNVDRSITSERWLARSAVTAGYTTGNVSWSHEAALQLTDDVTVRVTPGVAPSRALGQRLQAHYQISSEWEAGGTHQRLTGLIERDQDRLQSFSGPAAGSNQTQTLDTTALALDYGLGIDSFDLNLSVRHERNDRFDDATTWRAGAGWRFDGIDGRVHVAGGEGTKNPGIFELFGFFPAFWVGNPDLAPEKSQGWEIGWTQGLADGRGQWSATWFRSELEDEIFSDFGVFPATARNAVNLSERSGLEFDASWEFSDSLSGFASLSLLDSDQNGVAEIRRPERLASLTLDWHPVGSDLSGALTIDHTGDQLDTDFGTFQTVTLEAYTLVGGQIRWQATDAVEIYARGENLLDEEYQDVFGYHSQGRGLYIGLRLRGR